MEIIDWEDFTKVEIRVGRILSAEPLAKARRPAYVLQVDFGEELGRRPIAFGHSSGIAMSRKP
ncbi:MAG: hypothetical protein KDB18_10355 [Salinibacterium sp.]|nr:hypothetical protein [Salinibacterium sp.]